MNVSISMFTIELIKSTNTQLNDSQLKISRLHFLNDEYILNLMHIDVCIDKY